MQVFMKYHWRWFVIFLCYSNFSSVRASDYQATPQGQDTAAYEQATRLLSRFTYIKSQELTKWNETGTASYSISFEGELTVSAVEQGKDVMKIPFHYTQSTVAGPRPLILLFPPIDGDFPLEGTLCRFLAYMGISTIVAIPEEYLPDPETTIADIDQVIARVTVSSMHLLDWAEKRSEEIDSQKTGIFGISLGGIRGAMFMEADQRVKGAILVVSGGNLPEIITNSSQTKVNLYRNRRFEQENIPDLTTLLALLKEKVELDPISLAPLRHREDFLMLISANDTVVPSKNQWDLWEALGRPEYLSFPAGHVPTAMTSPFHLRRFYQFFKDRWQWDKGGDEGESRRIEEFFKMEKGNP